jgi:diacylglycerol kinase family enzyme
MEVVVVEPQSGLQIVKKLPAFLGGTLQEGAGIVMRSAASMDISCAMPIPFHVDGEPRMGPERISLRTRRGVLSVKVTG